VTSCLTELILMSLGYGFKFMGLERKTVSMCSLFDNIQGLH